MDILVDSGAEIHVCPPSFGDGSPLAPASGNMVIRSAGGHQLEYFGQRRVHMETGNGEKVQVDFHVAAVKRPILSVGLLISKGFGVVFGTGGAYIEKAAGGRLPLEARRGTFALPVRVVRPSKGQGAKRQEQQRAFDGRGGRNAQVFPVGAARGGRTRGSRRRAWAQRCFWTGRRAATVPPALLTRCLRHLRLDRRCRRHCPSHRGWPRSRACSRSRRFRPARRRWSSTMPRTCLTPRGARSVARPAGGATPTGGSPPGGGKTRRSS